MSAQCDDPHPELDRLIQFYNETGGEFWTDGTGWENGAAGLSCSPCSGDGWFGVQCEDGNIIGVHLPNNNLTGLATTAIDELTGLRVLDLSNNHLTGPLSSELLNSGVYHLDFSSNALNTQVPDFSNLLGDMLGDLYIDFDSCGLTGSLPVLLPLESPAGSIKTIVLSRNNLTGGIPASWAQEATTNDFIDISNNDLSGCYPEVLSVLCLNWSDTFISEGNDFDATWSEFCASGAGECNCKGDLNSDGTIDIEDFIEFNSVFGTECE